VATVVVVDIAVSNLSTLRPSPKESLTGYSHAGGGGYQGGGGGYQGGYGGGGGY